MALDFAARHWRWAVEIGLLAVSLYYAWKLMRGTRGARALAGLASVLAAAAFLAVFLQLYVIADLLRGLSGIFVLMLIILFQPELRTLLAELGSRRMRLGAEGKRTDPQLIEAIVGGIEALRREHFGALIAIERQEVYTQAGETGTRMDARVTSHLLATIFHEKTPLHDGGVIIRDQRVAFAAVVFPLTQAQRLQRRLGLRHRAALGLSEEIDAVVVVLSEETGRISLAQGGELERDLEPDDLRSRLNDLLPVPEPTPARPRSGRTEARRWLESLVQNWQAKLACTLMALVIWIVIRERQTPLSPEADGPIEEEIIGPPGENAT